VLYDCEFGSRPLSVQTVLEDPSNTPVVDLILLFLRNGTAKESDLIDFLVQRGELRSTSALAQTMQLLDYLVQTGAVLVLADCNERPEERVLALT